MEVVLGHPDHPGCRERSLLLAKSLSKQNKHQEALPFYGGQKEDGKTQKGGRGKKKEPRMTQMGADGRRGDGAGM